MPAPSPFPTAADAPAVPPTALAQRAPIAAVATAPGLGGVALIRLSGDGVYAIADRLAPRLSPPPSARPANTFAHATLVGANGETLDDAVLLFYRAPRSYTGEDTIELCVHGGRIVAEAVLGRLWELGARPAGPGAFTRRAFLNGRLDLTQAEAVADLIAARGPRAERAARANLEGRLGAALAPLYEATLALSGDVEHLLDFDEGELPGDFAAEAKDRVAALAGRLDALLATWREGRLAREGALVVLAGRPNAGKSTLLNLLLGCARAIVSPEPGTTRDSVEETFLLDGMPIRLVDTAGLREAPGAVEREGVARARALIARADAVLYLVAADDTDVPPPGAIPLRTKADLDGGPGISATAAPEAARAAVCDLLRRALKPGAGEVAAATLATERQRAGVAEAAAALRAARAALDKGEWGLVPAAQALREGAEALGRLLGRVWSDDLLDRLFSTFCIGK